MVSEWVSVGKKVRKGVVVLLSKVPSINIYIHYSSSLGIKDTSN